MKFIKTIAFFLVIGVMIMDAAGCGKAINHEELAVTLLNEKYNDEFEIDRLLRQSLFDGYYSAIAYQVDNPDIPFIVMVNSDGTGLVDDYVSKLVCRDLSDRVAQNLDEMEGVYYIYSEMLYDAWDLSDPAMGIDEFLREDPKMEFSVYVNYNPEHLDEENVYKCLSHAFDGLGEVDGYVRFYICDNGMLKRMQEYLETNDKMYDDYRSMTAPYYLGKIEYQNGRIAVGAEEVARMIREHEN